MSRLNIKFSRRGGTYRKLVDCRAGGIFTTVRRWTGDKEKYYRENVGKEFQIEYTDYDFKGIPDTDLLMLIFQKGAKEYTATLIQVMKTHKKELSREFVEYDTEKLKPIR